MVRAEKDYLQPPEVLRREQNAFLYFLDENKELFERHSSLTYDLRDEDEGWRNSQTLDSIVSMGIDLTLLLYPGLLNKVTRKQIRRVKIQVRANVANFVFGTSNDNTSNITYLSDFPTKRQYTQKSQDLSKDLDLSLNDFRTSFQEARAPLLFGIRESRAELMKRFEDFLLSEPSNIFAFGDFLSDKKNHGAEVEAIRPFLSSLADSEQTLPRDNKEGILSRVVKQWIGELKEKPNFVTIDEFVVSIKSSKPSNVLGWLEFAAQEKSIANLLRSRTDVSTWPTELREAFSSFISSKYFNALSSVKKDLEQYRKRLNLKGVLRGIDSDSEGEITGTRMAAVSKKPNNKKGEGELQKAEREKYPVGILTKAIGMSFAIRLLTEEEVAYCLQKEADSLVPADHRMAADLEKIFLSLRKDAYGLGTEKLKDRDIAIGHKRLPLRSLNPRKRIGLSLDHPDSHDIRVVYVIHNNNGVSAIGLEGVYRHGDYISKFMYHK